MFKQLAIFAFIFTLISPTFSEEKSNTEPKYKISETDIKILIRQMNNIEQCIFPELANNANPKAIYDKWTDADRFTMFIYQRDLLIELVGRQNAQTIFDDPPSQAYYQTTLDLLNHQNAHLDQEKCDTYLKPHYQQLKKNVEAKLK